MASRAWLRRQHSVPPMTHRHCSCACLATPRSDTRGAGRARPPRPLLWRRAGGLAPVSRLRGLHEGTRGASAASPRRTLVGGRGCAAAVWSARSARCSDTTARWKFITMHSCMSLIQPAHPAQWRKGRRKLRASNAVPASPRAHHQRAHPLCAAAAPSLHALAIHKLAELLSQARHDPRTRFVGWRLAHVTARAAGSTRTCVQARAAAPHRRDGSDKRTSTVSDASS